MIHILAKPQIIETAAGKKYKRRSWARSNIFAITSFAMPAGSSTYWKTAPRMINLKLHSSWTWKSVSPEKVRASTELTLSRDDALLIATALLNAVNELDEGKYPDGM